MKNKILHLIDSGGLYGAEIMILNLIQEQLKVGRAPMLLSVGTGEDINKPIEVEAKRRGLPYKKWRMKSGLNISGINEIIQWSNSEGYEILHSHGYKFNILLAVSRMTGHQFLSVATIHGYTDSPAFSKSWVYKYLDGLALKIHDRVCVVSPHMLDFPSIASIKAHNVSVVENGLDVISSTAKSSDCGFALENFLATNDVNLLAIGRLSEEKNFIGLIESMSLLVGVHKRIGLVIVGDGIQRDALEIRIRDMALCSRVMLLGYKTDAHSLMKCFDMLVISSHSEGLPICLLEAMREGLPVVATPVGGIPEVLQGGMLGSLAKSSKPDDIFHAVSEALNSKECLLDKAALAKKVFVDKYTIRQMCEKYNFVYDSI